MKLFRVTIIIDRECDHLSPFIIVIKYDAQTIIQEDCEDNCLYIENIEEIKKENK